MEKIHTLQARVTPGQMKKIVHLQEKTGLSASQLVRTMIDRAELTGHPEIVVKPITANVADSVNFREDDK